MNCISLLQPWASAVEIGVKTIETRSWAAPKSAIGQPLAIAASRGRPKHSREIWDQIQAIPALRDAFRARSYYKFEDLPMGQVVCTTVLDLCVSTNDQPPTSRTPAAHDGLLGDFSVNRYAWFLSGITRLPEPTPVIGRLGIFQWERQPASL